MPPSRRRGDPLTDERMELMVLLADTNWNLAAIWRRLGDCTYSGMLRREKALYEELGVSGREELRVYLLECELAAVGS